MDEKWTIIAKLKKSKEYLRNTVRKKNRETNLLRKVLTENFEKGREGIQSNWNKKLDKKPLRPNKNNSKRFELGNTTGT